MDDLRTTLDREAARVHAPMDAKSAVLERAGRNMRRRRASARALGLAITLVLIGGLAFIRIGAMRTSAGGATWAGIWPQSSSADGLEAQQSADAGDPSAAWQLDGVLVLKRFAQERFGWEAPTLERIANADEVSEPGAPIDDPATLSDPGTTGPVRVLVMGCAPGIGRTSCPAAYITVQRLIRDDSTGIWSVTAYESTTVVFAASPSPAG